ncbi:cyclin-like protein [Dendrothele bispora CBS 962.96]|uniref:Cyclin-like protein n=1 Tax=Dendrothele bispora (strain CBS 962.96) TaxID=1314807 RepID=A0A4S8MNS1_DENBC|nr:cyclin-like protein [Dendrothele bispora CBS 962.96]
MDPRANTSSHARASSPSTLPASSIKYHYPYFTPSEVESMSEKQRGKMSIHQEERIRSSAMGFLEVLGSRMGFPRRTIATSQSLYHRFHLFFPRKDFTYTDVCLAALYVSTKMHDTLKKPREILANSYSVRFPELAVKSKNPSGEVDLDSMDPQVVEHDRQRLLAVERLILETICFNFTSHMPFPYVIKMGKALGATKTLTKLAYRLSVDSYRSSLPLSYPPHALALGSLYVAALLLSFEQPEGEEQRRGLSLASQLGQRGAWEDRFRSALEELEAIAHLIVDILIAGTQSPSANTSPSTPQSPSPHPSPRERTLPHNLNNSNGYPPSIPYKPDVLIRLKIAMRESDHEPKVRTSYREISLNGATAGNTGMVSGTAVSFSKEWRQSGAFSNGAEREVEAKVGRNEGTVRFLFEPPGFEAHRD